MNVVAFLSQKGGSGKTTLSVHTAVAAEEGGERVCIIDADPQESATAWARARQAETPIVATAQASELEVAVAAARGERMTLRDSGCPPSCNSCRKSDCKTSRFSHRAGSTCGV